MLLRELDEGLATVSEGLPIRQRARLGPYGESVGYDLAILVRARDDLAGGEPAWALRSPRRDLELVDEVRFNCNSLSKEIDDGGNVGGTCGEDCQAVARRLLPQLAALDAIGWPHKHDRPGREYPWNPPPREMSPWGEDRDRDAEPTRGEETN